MSEMVAPAIHPLAALASGSHIQQMRKAATAGPVWRALKSFSYVDPDIGRVTINRGEFVYSATHLAVLRRPDCFVKTTRGATRGKPRATTPINASQGAVTPRSAQPPATRPEPFVRVSAAEAPFAVSLSRSARLVIEEHAFAARGRYEVCGGLFGVPARFREDTATVLKALEPGPGTRSDRSSATPDLEYIRREAGRFLRAESDLRWIGSWHTHPGGNGEPSPADLRFWADDWRELNEIHGQRVPNYIAFVVVPGEQARNGFFEPSWVKPKIHAWRLRTVGGNGDQFICSRADLSLTG